MKNTAAFVVAAMLLMPLSAGAVSQWSAVGATGTVISPNVVYFPYPTGGVYSAPMVGGNGAGVSYAYTTSGTGETNPFTVAYNVTSPEMQPTWTTLTIDYSGVNSGSSITATLYSVVPATGARTTVCSVSSVIAGTTGSCTFSSATFDFSSNGYYVEATVSRNSISQRPTLIYLRVN